MQSNNVLSALKNRCTEILKAQNKTKYNQKLCFLSNLPKIIAYPFGDLVLQNRDVAVQHDIEALSWSDIYGHISRLSLSSVDHQCLKSSSPILVWWFFLSGSLFILIFFLYGLLFFYSFLPFVFISDSLFPSNVDITCMWITFLPLTMSFLRARIISEACLYFQWNWVDTSDTFSATVLIRCKQKMYFETQKGPYIVGG